MTTRFDALTRPKTLDEGAQSKHRSIGFGLAFIGLMLVTVALIANIAAANSNTETGATFAWTFGLTTLGFGTLKLGIGVVLVGILIRLWLRVTSVKDACAALKPDADVPAPRGTVQTEFGDSTETATTPDPLPIHRMARTMWFPMLAMGFMIVMAGFFVSLIWAGGIDDGTQQAAQAWTQGLQFLGEGMLLAGISFLLGSILAALREGGGIVQESLGLPVRTLVMPKTAKLFVGFMALGLMVSMIQFVLYIVAAGVASPQSYAAWLAWLGPFREVGLGLLLAGIVLALVTIGNVLSFQFDRIRQIVTTGK